MKLFQIEISAEISRTWYRFKQIWLNTLFLGITLGIILIAIFSYQLAPYPEDEYAVHTGTVLQAPSYEHPFGTDEMGRDLLSRILIGSRISLFFAAILMILAVSIGTGIGLIAGYLGGLTDIFTMRIADILLSIPPIVLVLVITAILTPSLETDLIACALVWWPSYARIVRIEVLRIKEETFVEASKSIGASSIYIMFRDIIPNALPTIITKVALDIGYAILMLAMLGFLGLGPRPPAPEWGTIACRGRGFLPECWWVSTFSGLMVFLTVFSFNLLGDGIRDALRVETR